MLSELGFKATVFIITGELNDGNTDMVTWSQLQGFSPSVFDVESHTVTHRDLTTLGASALRTELVNSKQALESHLGKEIRVISYPYGEYNSTVEQAAWQAGYFMGPTAWGGVEPNSADKLALQRISMLTTTSVDYDPSNPSEFLFTKIADSTVKVPQLTINSIQYLDASTGQPLVGNTAAPGQTVLVRVTITSAGPANPGVVSLQLDNDNSRSNGVYYDSHLQGQDYSWNYAAGAKTIDFLWTVPDGAPSGQYYADVKCYDQYHVLGFKDSTWRQAFQVANPIPHDNNPHIISARDGQTISVGYKIESLVAANVQLGYTLVDPGNKKIDDAGASNVVSVTPGTQWYYRDVKIKLHPHAPSGKYDVTWKIHWGPGGDGSVSKSDYLTIDSPVSVRVPILMYHKVAPVAHSEWWVTTANFRAQMEALKAYGYTAITQQDLMNYRAGTAAAPAKPVLITFDDGYENLFTDAYPVLSDPAINYKATSYIITSKVGGTNAWDAGENNPIINHLTWSEIKTLNDDPKHLIDFQSHSVTHPPLTQVSAAELAAELANSKQQLESQLGNGKQVNFLCYPYGDYNAAVQQAAWGAGYQAAVIAGGFDADSRDKYALGRPEISWTTSVDYDTNHPEDFFFTVIEDQSVVVPRITISSTQYLDPATGQPLPGNAVAAGQSVLVRVTASNTGPATTGVVSLRLDNDSNHDNGIAYDSHAAGQDLTWNFASGTQTFNFTWQVPGSAAAGRYYSDVKFHDQHHVLGFKDSLWQQAFSVTGTTVAPQITTQPQNKTVQAGTPATFSVVATGTAPLGYQWQRNGSNITGATSASYRLASPTSADNGAQFRVVVSNAGGSVTSSVATLTVTSSGTGLKGQYYDNSDFTNLKLTRTDATVNFNWGSGSPNTSIGANTFSVRWTGQVQPQYTQTYTFYTSSDDGVRLWVNGRLLISNWTNHGVTTDSGSIALSAGQKYNIEMDYYENTGSAIARLYWSCTGLSKQIIPASRLFLAAADTLAPDKPTGLSLTSQTSTSVVLAWANTLDNFAVVRYDVFRNGVKAGSTFSNNYTDTGLTAGSSYAYTVQACDAAGNASPLSDPLSVTTNTSMLTLAQSITAGTISAAQVAAEPSFGADSAVLALLASRSDAKQGKTAADQVLASDTVWLPW